MWRVLVPVKGGPTAKSRLDLEPRHRRALAAAMAYDTVAAVLACPTVGQVTVLCGRDLDLDLPRGAATLDEPDDPVAAGDESLNVRLQWALVRLAEVEPRGGPLAVVVADLPALTGPALQRVLQQAAATERGVVVDRHGTGTTVLTASHGAALRPRFGPRSAAAHATGGAVALEAAPGVRSDVDTLSDLRAASALGIGARTRAVLDAGVH